MREIKLIAWLLLAILLTGCAASGPKHADIMSTLPTIAQGKNRIYFYRENSMMGAAIQPEIKLNGVVVGKSAPGGFFFVDRGPGKYAVTTSTEVEKSAGFTLTTGQTRYVQTSVSMGFLVGHVTPRLMDPEQAEKDLRNLSYTGPAFNVASAPSAPVAQRASEKKAAPAPAPVPAPAPAGYATMYDLPPPPPPPAPVPDSDPVQIQTVEFRSGISSATVEKIAQQHGCKSGKGAALITDRGPVEVYRMTCEDGTTFMARCELRQCRSMR